MLSCNQRKTDKSVHPTENFSGQNSDTTDHTVKLSLESAALRLSELPEAIKVTLTNNTTDTIIIGEHFRIEKFEANKWLDFSPKDIVFHDIGFDLKPNCTKTFNKKLFKNKINYKPGKYRIVKYYLKSDYQQTKEDFDVHAEFEIK